jgi:nucleotide-binding universal stress UspA family protein
MELRRVLVGVDGSAASAAAARWAAEAVGDRGEVIALHATGTALIGQAARSAATGLGIFPTEKASKEEAQRVVDQWCAPLRDSGVAYRSAVSDSEPVKALLECARREDVDLIVIGHQGETGILHRLVQGLSDHLIDNAQRPVVVIPG